MDDRAQGEMPNAAGANSGVIRTPWSEVERAVPQLAAAVHARLAANRHHLLATIRPDGSPRLSGTEVRFADGHLQLGMMARSLKLADVERDPRIEIHSAPLEDDLQQGDARVHGRAVYLAPAGEAEGSMFAIDVEQEVLVQVQGDELVVTHWTPGGGLHEIRRQ